MTEEQLQPVPANRDERRQAGKALRQQAPLDSHAYWTSAADRPDPLTLLQAQDQGRLVELLPIKYGRMLASPFAFFRGSAIVMAADLTSSPASGIEVVLCGDAHLANFGVFASPERRLVFDINDFDEAFPGPWEWDLKRLATSAVLAGRANGFGANVCRDLAVDTARAYSEAIAYFAEMSALDQWYYHVDVDEVVQVFARSSKRGQKGAQEMVRKARARSAAQTLDQLTRIEDGRRRIIADPPLLVPFRDMGLEARLSAAELKQLGEQGVVRAWEQYLASLPDERSYLLRRFRITDGALRVGGIGSVGTRCVIALLHGEAAGDALILQLKEAGPSVLEAYLGRRDYPSQSQRVVTAQRLMQAVGDAFLGWHTSALSGRAYYWRQLRDMKASADVASLDAAGLRTYLGICGWSLARAHARTGDRLRIRGYLGRKDTFAEAVGTFAVAYADQVERDHAALAQAVKAGRIAVETGV